MSIELTDVIAECNDLDAVHAVEDAIAKRYGRDSVGVVGHREIIAYRAGFAAASARAPSVGRVIAACAMLVPLLIEGWDEYDDSEDQRKGSAAVDELIAAWKEYDAHDQSERCSSKYTAAPRHGIAPMTSSDHHPAPSVPPSGTRGLNDWGRVAQVWHAGTVEESSVGPPREPIAQNFETQLQVATIIADRDTPPSEPQAERDGLVQRLHDFPRDLASASLRETLLFERCIEAADRIEADAKTLQQAQATVARLEASIEADAKCIEIKDASNAKWREVYGREYDARMTAEARIAELEAELHRWNSAPGCVACMRKGTTELGHYCSVCGSRTPTFLAATPATGSDDAKA